MAYFNSIRFDSIGFIFVMYGHWTKNILHVFVSVCVCVWFQSFVVFRCACFFDLSYIGRRCYTNISSTKRWSAKLIGTGEQFKQKI